MEKDKRERKVRDEASEGRRLEREVLLMNCKSNTTPWDLLGRKSEEDKQLKKSDIVHVRPQEAMWAYSEKGKAFSMNLEKRFLWEAIWDGSQRYWEFQVW